MKIRISLEAESDLANGFWFYEDQEAGLGNRFRSSVKADIRSLAIHGSTHSVRHGYHRMVCKKFPFNIYYEMNADNLITVVAIFSQRRGSKWVARRLGGSSG